jgi:hypothetical protein
MAEIYVTGAVSDWDDPFQWHDELEEDWNDQEFVNPYTLNDFELGDEEVYERPNEVVEPALDAVESVDGLLVRWDDDAFLVGTAMEMKHAFEHDVPVVIWYDGWRENLSPWLLYHSRGNFESRNKALKVLLSTIESTDSFNFLHKDA